MLYNGDVLISGRWYAHPDSITTLSTFVAPLESDLQRSRRPNDPPLTITIDQPIQIQPITPPSERPKNNLIHRPPPPPSSPTQPYTPFHPPPPTPFVPYSSLPAFPLPLCATCPTAQTPIPPMPSNFGYFPSPPTDTIPLGFDHGNENTRQVSLHYALKHLSAHTGMNIWGVIRDHLKVVHEEGRRSSVLDLGCGTGIFCYELGKEEIFADVIGVE